MFRVLTLLALGVFVASPAAARADDEPKDILAKAIKAHGGEELFTKNQAGQTKAKGKLTIGGAEVEFTQDVSYMMPDKHRDSLEISVGGNTITVLTIVNGDKITMEVNGKEMDVPDQAKDALKHMRHVQKLARLVPLKDKAYELSLIGDDKVEGKKVVGIRVSAKDQKDVSLYFDKETWLLAKVEYRGMEPGTGKEVNEERILTEYAKNKDGVPVPKKLLVKHDGKTFVEAEIVEMTLLEKLDDSVFKK
jgi:hypothetical protein